MQPSQSNINNLAQLLSQAFFSDPLFQHFFPDEITRSQLSFYTFKFIVSHALKKGFVFETSNALKGVAVWLPSKNINRNLMDQLRFGALSMLLQQGSDAINRQKAASEYMKRLHVQQLKTPHLYLSTIAVDAVHRGQGFASKLILPMLAEADAKSLACYLDTHNEANVKLYQRFGFQVYHESTIPDSDVRHWAMIRHQL